jgi:hypothetical protein
MRSGLSQTHPQPYDFAVREKYGTLGEEKMDMLRHDYVADDYKLITLADLLHNFEEEIARAGCPEKGTVLITTCGNRVRVSSAVVAVQVGRH